MNWSNHNINFECFLCIHWHVWTKNIWQITKCSYMCIFWSETTPLIVCTEGFVTRKNVSCNSLCSNSLLSLYCFCGQYSPEPLSTTDQNYCFLMRGWISTGHYPKFSISFVQRPGCRVLFWCRLSSDVNRYITLPNTQIVVLGTRLV